MTRIFNFNSVSERENQSKLSIDFPVRPLSEYLRFISPSGWEVPMERSFVQSWKNGGKRVTRFLTSCFDSSSNTAGADLSGDTRRFSKVTPGALIVWDKLPDEIKYDPALNSFKQLYERKRGQRLLENARVHNNMINIQPCEGVTDDLIVPRKLYERSEIHKLAPNAFTIKLQQSVFREDGLDMPHANSVPVQPAVEHDEKETRMKLMNVLYYVKMTMFVLMWIWITATFMVCSVKKEVVLQTYVVPGQTKDHIIEATRTDLRLQLTVTGPFATPPASAANASVALGGPQLAVWLERWSAPADQAGLTTSAADVKQMSKVVKLKLLSDDSIDFAIPSTHTFVLTLPDNASEHRDESGSFNSSQVFVMRMRSNSPRIASLSVSYSEVLFKLKNGVIYALVILMTLNILTIFEIVNLTFATMLTSTISLTVLAAVGERPSVEQVISWIDMESLLLLFSMMLLIAILTETGILDYLAVIVFKWTNGRVWPLIFSLCLTTALISTFLDNVTTLLLMTPITIRVCEVMDLNPVPVLIATIIYSNLGGTATPVGDPSNVIIVSNHAVIAAGINYLNYTAHMLGGIVLVGLQTFLQLRWTFRDAKKLLNSAPKDKHHLKKKLAVWRRAAASLTRHNADEALVREALERHAARLQLRLRRVQLAPPALALRDSHLQTLRQMEQKYPIKDMKLLIKATIALSFVIMIFFLQTLPDLKRLSLGWAALLGAILLLILADRADLEPIILHIQWSTLVSCAALFVLMEALAKLGLTDYIANLTEHIVIQIRFKDRLMAVMLFLLWVSALTSAFVDNFPLTTLMVQMADSLAVNPALTIPFTPLIWAIAFGSCLGGNGTLIGASSNMVCVNLAAQRGYRITFFQFAKFCFPIMIGQIIVISIYLIFCHCIFNWH